MNDALQEAAMLLAIGMITVFLILFLIVGLGNLLIRIVNRFFPEKTASTPPLTPSESPPETLHRMRPAQLTAIVAAVQTITRGQGKVSNIQKVT